MDKIWIGAAYYPEDWDEDQMDFDIAKMLEFGFNVARVGEFAWHVYEPVEGQISFSWLEKVVDKLYGAGIDVILGTPTATPPHWFYKKYPQAAALSAQGIPRQHGGRRHICSCNPDYQRHSAIIVEAMARALGRHPGVKGWQIDNEIYPMEDYCCCEHCMAAFHAHLKEKYHTVEELNRRWNLNLFSQAYDAFEDVPAPFNAWHNPHIQLEWRISQANNHVRFVHAQAQILKRYTDAPIGTDATPQNGIDYRYLHQPLDVVQYNHYNRPNTIHGAALMLDYMQGFSKMPLWNTETQPCWNGDVVQGMAVFPKDYLYFNTWLPIMLGGGASMFWLWRIHWAGHELMHGGVLESWGRPTYANDELRRAARDFVTARKTLTQTTVTSDSAILYTSLNWNIKKSQTVNKWTIPDDARTGEVINFYGKLIGAGIHPHVIDCYQDLSEYKLLFAPCAFSVDEGDFPRRVSQWVREGGVLVAGPLTDIRNADGAKYTKAPYGFLEELSGATQVYHLPHDDGRLPVVDANGQSVHCEKSFEVFEPAGFDSWLTLTGDRECFTGRSVCLACPVGKGWVIHLGTFPEEKAFGTIARRAAGLAGARVFDVDRGVMVTRRVYSDGREALIVAVMGDEAGSMRFEGSYRDVLTDTLHRGQLTLAPWNLAVLEPETP